MEDKKTPWGEIEKREWLKEQSLKRSYQDEVAFKVNALKKKFAVRQYGALSYDVLRYPLFCLQTSTPNPLKKTVLITGGVHGYETSGVQGALRFLEEQAERYSENFNFVVMPCISPWGYETINRWNPSAIDPNRSFYEGSPSEECHFFIEELKRQQTSFFAHIDLHETTDTDNTVFRPALEKRDAVKQEVWDIPDGFYLVGDSENPTPEFQKAMIDEVRKVTHIAPADEKGKIIGKPISQEGVIHYPVKKLHLCAGVSDAKFCSTTEVYPDSPKADDEICIRAQVAALKGGLNYLLTQI